MKRNHQERDGRLRTRVAGAVALLCCAWLSSCANRLVATTAPEYEGRLTIVESLGVAGEGSTAAIPAFQSAGYRVVDLGFGDDPIATANERSIPFVAFVSPTDAEGSWWDGMFSYAMRVTETTNGTIVWSATADYGQGGVAINQTRSTKSAMQDMVADFCKSFPPSVAEQSGGSGDASPNTPMQWMAASARFASSRGRH